MTPRDQALQLIDQARALEAQALGKRMEACMLLGQRDEARRCMHQMNGITAVRRVARFAEAEMRGECHFVTSGNLDGEGLR